jgi:hypothetical protein
VCNIAFRVEDQDSAQATTLERNREVVLPVAAWKIAVDVVQDRQMPTESPIARTLTDVTER